MPNAAPAPQGGRSAPTLGAAGCSVLQATSEQMPAAGTLTSSHRAPLRLSGRIFRSLPEIILEKAGRPASLPDVVGRTQALGRRRCGTLSNDAIVKPEASVTRGSHWEAPRLRRRSQERGSFCPLLSVSLLFLHCVCLCVFFSFFVGLLFLNFSSSFTFCSVFSFFVGLLFLYFSSKVGAAPLCAVNGCR